MDFVLNRTAKYVLVGLAIVAMAKVAWVHRSDEWVPRLLRPVGPAKLDIKFDNGSVRDSLVPDEGRSAGTLTTDPTVRNVVGVLKKCLQGGKVVYTDQVCPIGAKVVAINGGGVAVLESQKSKASDATAARGSRKVLRDALDLSEGESLKDKMIEQAMKR